MSVMSDYAQGGSVHRGEAIASSLGDTEFDYVREHPVKSRGSGILKLEKTSALPTGESVSVCPADPRPSRRKRRGAGGSLPVHNTEGLMEPPGIRQFLLLISVFQ